MTANLYCDGGCVKANPSPIGGTWAFVIVSKEGEEQMRGSGFISASQVGLPYVTNNYTELLAAVEGLEQMPEGWDGFVLTDSNVTRCRILPSCPNPKMNGIPVDLQRRLTFCKNRLGRYGVILLSGHPTKNQLAEGFGKHHLPVSKWNVLCDDLCRKAGQAAVERVG